MAERPSTTNTTETTIDVMMTVERETQEPVSSAVIRAVTTAAGVSFDELPPLYEAVDPDAVESLCSSVENWSTIEFEYAGYHLTIHDGDTINIRETTATNS